MQWRNARIPSRLRNSHTDGILFERDTTPPENAVAVDQFRLTRWARVAYVGADGSAEIRFQVNSADYRGALITVLCTIYALGSQLPRNGPWASLLRFCHTPPW